MDDDPDYQIGISFSDFGRAGAGPVFHGLDRTAASWIALRGRIRRGAARAVREALVRHGARAARIHVAVVDDAEMARLNRQFLDRAGSTDVLAFDLGDEVVGPRAGRGFSVGETTSRLVEGDVAVSIETAARQARRRGHSVAAEVALYALHGALHLLGYNDEAAAEASRMHQMEDQILCAAGLGPVFEGAGKPKARSHSAGAGSMA